MIFLYAIFNHKTTVIAKKLSTFFYIFFLNFLYNSYCNNTTFKYRYFFYIRKRLSILSSSCWYYFWQINFFFFENHVDFFSNFFVIMRRNFLNSWQKRIRVSFKVQELALGTKLTHERNLISSIVHYCWPDSSIFFFFFNIKLEKMFVASFLRELCSFNQQEFRVSRCHHQIPRLVYIAHIKLYIKHF